MCDLFFGLHYHLSLFILILVILLRHNSNARLGVWTIAQSQLPHSNQDSRAVPSLKEIPTPSSLSVPSMNSLVCGMSYKQKQSMQYSVVCTCHSSFETYSYCSIYHYLFIGMYHGIFIHSTVKGHLCCLEFEMIMSKAIINICICLWTLVFIQLGKYLGVGLLGPLVIVHQVGFCFVCFSFCLPCFFFCYSGHSNQCVVIFHCD